MVIIHLQLYREWYAKCCKKKLKLIENFHKVVPYNIKDSEFQPVLRWLPLQGWPTRIVRLLGPNNWPLNMEWCCRWNPWPQPLYPILPPSAATILTGSPPSFRSPSTPATARSSPPKPARPSLWCVIRRQRWWARIFFYEKQNIAAWNIERGMCF